MIKNLFVFKEQSINLKDFQHINTCLFKKTTDFF